MKKHEFRSLAVAAMAMAMAVAVAWISLPGCSDAKAPADNGRNAAKPTADAAARAEFLKQHQLTGRVALIQFGTVTCELSDKGLREMALLHKLKAIPGLEFLRVEASKDDEAVKAYYETQSLKFPMHRDPQGLLGRTFDATVYPTFVLVGKFAHVRYRGKQPDNRLAEWVQGLLAERADPGHDVALLGTVKLDGAKLLAQTALPDLGGKRRRLQDLFGPGGMLAVFVDTTCPFSSQAMKDVPTVSRTLAAGKIPSVVINVDDPEAKVKTFYAKRNLGAMVLFDTSPKTRNLWNVHSVPRVVYIAPNKTVAYNGKAVWADLGTAIERARGLPAGSIRFTAKGTSFG